jgi:HEPN domain-containing protein
MSETTDPLAWIAKAEEDYTMARLALRRKTPLTSSACFHAQQCAEKYLKAALVANGSQFPKVHDLLKLSLLCEQVGVLIPLDADQLDKLSISAVQVRYPGDGLTLGEAKEALEIAKRVRRFVRKSLAIT